MKYAVYFSLAACLLAVGHAELKVSPSDVTYKLFTRQQLNGVLIRSSDAPNFANIRNVFNPALPTVVLVHGWQDNYEADSNTFIRQAVLSKFNSNVIKVDWSVYSTQGYLTARNAVPPVGRIVAQLLQSLSTRFNYPLANVYLAGFSLGAHLVGNIGKNLPGQIEVIVALDPAGPLISSSDVSFSVHPSDARFVQGIHTNAGTLGMSDAVGHADYYPNGGSRQPGCGLDLLGSCAHNRAWEYFAESLGNNRFRSLGCSRWSDFSAGRCTGGTSLLGGLGSIDRNARGLFYLETNNRSPYGRG